MTEIKYKNTLLTSLEAGKTITLFCSGRKMEGDIAITAVPTLEYEGAVRDAVSSSLTDNKGTTLFTANGLKCRTDWE
jgi:hypothetical protein